MTYEPKMMIGEMVGGGKDPNRPYGSKPVEFHILPVDSESIADSLGRIEVSPQVVRETMEEMFKGIIKEKCDRFKLVEIIQQTMARRIEVAVKNVMMSLEKDIGIEARKYATKKLHDHIDAMNLNVSVSSTQPPATE